MRASRGQRKRNPRTPDKDTPARGSPPGYTKERGICVAATCYARERGRWPLRLYRGGHRRRGGCARRSAVLRPDVRGGHPPVVVALVDIDILDLRRPAFMSVSSRWQESQCSFGGGEAGLTNFQPSSLTTARERDHEPVAQGIISLPKGNSLYKLIVLPENACRTMETSQLLSSQVSARLEPFSEHTSRWPAA